MQDDAWKPGPMAGNIVGKVGNPQHGSFRGKTIYKGPGYAETENVPLIFPVIKLGIYWGYAVMFFGDPLKLWLHQIAESWILHDLGDTKRLGKSGLNLKVTK